MKIAVELRQSCSKRQHSSRTLFQDSPTCSLLANFIRRNANILPVDHFLLSQYYLYLSLCRVNACKPIVIFTLDWTGTARNCSNNFRQQQTLQNDPHKSRILVIKADFRKVILLRTSRVRVPIITVRM